MFTPIILVLLLALVAADFIMYVGCSMRGIDMTEVFKEGLKGIKKAFSKKK